MGLLKLFYNDFQERGSWKKSFLLVFLVVQYIIWVLIVTICSIENQNQSGSNNSSPSSGSSSSSSSTSPSSMVLLPYPLAIYAWSIAQAFTTIGILTPFSTLLTKKSWESFDYRFAVGNNDNDDNVVGVLPPMKIPILNVQDYSHNNQDNDDDADASGVIRAKQYLESTYGKDWIERPLLLQGLWTQKELLEGNKNENENNENNENERNKRSKRKRKRLLTPNGLLTMTNLTIPYFTNATNPTALIPDGYDTVSNIIQGMIYDQKPYKIGSQYIVQNDPTLLFNEIIPNDNDNNQLFLTQLFGNHFSPEKITGHSIFEFHGIKMKLPGTTTVPVFIANTITTISKDKDKATTTTTTQKNEECRSGSSSSTLSNTNDDDDSSSCKNTDNSHKNGQDDDQEEEVPITNPVLTGLHCEPIANLAVQLWGSRTWTLVNPIHSWKLRPSIATDGRSYYPSSISKKDLTRKIPRYRITTNPGDAVWLPTWTYHQVEYTTTSTSKTKTTTTKVIANDNDEDEVDDNDEENENSKMILLSQLSIGASIFHFRPYDYIRRNPLFALLLIPSLLKELIGMKTQ
jgi:hypothetical protein